MSRKNKSLVECVRYQRYISQLDEMIKTERFKKEVAENIRCNTFYENYKKLYDMYILSLNTKNATSNNEARLVAESIDTTEGQDNPNGDR